ncbi:MAG: hypothetical protein HYX68_05170 [Planctomycetes bacterium]|nr:hypothetical protein [Planctomycetota bacterium]
MNPPSKMPCYLPRYLQGWEQFWFQPADPTKLALIRITCGLIVIYTLFVYTFKLQEFEGEHAWHALDMRMEFVREHPTLAMPLNWYPAGVTPSPRNQFEINYVQAYRKKTGRIPPPPYPRNQEEADYLDEYYTYFKFDLRQLGITPSLADEDKAYAWRYAVRWGAPPPAYVKSQEEEDTLNEYIEKHKFDPRLVHAVGSPIFSLWFHVLDPRAMMVVHCLIVAISVMFTLGFCTRITSALLWFGYLCYINRNPNVLFGVDTMTNILLLYLMISPCGAVYSLDRVIRKWWVGAKMGLVESWYRFWRLPVPTNIAPPTPVPDVPEPSVSANVALRLLQIHVCFIYGMAGLSKLLGRSWWDGSAIWMTVANYEFAPMENAIYMRFLRFLGSYQVLYMAFVNGGGLFTLVFEIGYPFLIWRPRLRWVFLASAIVLHGGIGLFMGLKTFSLIMLVMNMAFLRPAEANWMLERMFNPRLLFRRATAVPHSTESNVPVSTAS